MGWIKRNLIFVIGVALAVGLLGAAIYYDCVSWNHNQDAFLKLNEIYTSLAALAKQTPSPGNGQVDNIAAAREQEARLRQWVEQSRKYFQPIPRIPASGPLSNESFGHALSATIKQLQDAAAVANVQLPPQYSFSFTTDVGRLKFADNSLGPLSTQLGEVKAITEILYAARVNALDGIQRVPVSDDDKGGPQTDYLNDQPVTTDLGVLTPYQVTFRAFSPEVAQVLEAIAAAPHGLIVKTISVQPVGSGTGAPVLPAPGKGGLQTVLNEQLLRVTLVVEVVKLTPNN
jgi:hypothetical protein